MPRIVVEAQINAAPDRVFTYMTDLRNVAPRVSGIEKIEVVSTGPIGIGTRWRETRRFGRHEAVEEMEFTEYAPGKSFTVRCDSHGMRYISRYVLHPEQGETRVSIDFDAKPISIAAKILSPLGRIMLGPVAKCLRQDLDDIKLVAEKEAHAPAELLPA